MDLIATLGGEHKRILRVLSALERLGVRLTQGTPVDTHAFLRVITFLRGFADGYHHEREEQVLLKALASLEFSANSGVLEFIRQQHREERVLLSHLEASIIAPLPWSNEAISAITKAIRELVAFEREHMTKENELLFPEAQRLFAERGTADLERRMERYDRDRAPSWSVTWLEKLGDEIANDDAS